MYVNLGQLEQALSDLSEIIDNFPRESCVYEVRVGRALADRGKLHCLLENPEDAASDLSRAAEMGVLDAVAWQETLRRHGYYDGALNGVVGPGTLGAIQSFALAGCPGLT